ncbi:MAG: response regulator [Halobacteriota archaeon]
MNRSLNGEPIKILLVEDSPSDIDLTKEALEEGMVIHELFVVEDGVAAMQFLNREGAYADVPRPDLVLLDLNLPQKDGREVLAEIKGDPELKRLPVIVLTTSAAEEDICSTYEHYVNCYITKPVDVEEFIRVVHSLGEFWLSFVRLPPTCQR